VGRTPVRTAGHRVRSPALDVARSWPGGRSWVPGCGRRVGGDGGGRGEWAGCLVEEQLQQQSGGRGPVLRGRSSPGRCPNTWLQASRGGDAQFLLPRLAGRSSVLGRGNGCWGRPWADV